jgi:hypothetical protein
VFLKLSADNGTPRRPREVEASVPEERLEQLVLATEKVEGGCAWAIRSVASSGMRFASSTYFVWFHTASTGFRSGAYGGSHSIAMPSPWRSSFVAAVSTSANTRAR